MGAENTRENVDWYDGPESQRSIDEANTNFVAGMEHAAAQKAKRGPSIAEQLVTLAVESGVALFHDGADGDGYARVPVSNHVEVHPINSRGFKRWLGRCFHKENGKSPNAEAFGSARNTLDGMAQYDGEEHKVYVRVAGCDGAIYIDLCDPAWRVVEVTRDGWRIIPGDDAPVRFIRRRGMEAMPEPIRGGSIDELRGLVNIPDDDQWRLYVAWIVAALRPTTAYPVLSICGEQGSAKSTAARLARALVDPSEVPLTSKPKTIQDVHIAVRNSHVTAFNNLSYLSSELSDCLCTVADGSGYRTRSLYTNNEEEIFKGARPICLNGIVNVASKSDLADRALFLTLPCITDTERRTDDEIKDAFDAMHPRLFGALCDVLAVAIRNNPEVHLPSKPRMAGFAQWIVAAAPAMPWAVGTFLTAYTNDRADAYVITVEADAVGDAVLRFMQEREDWEGTSSELLVELNRMVDDKTRERDWWPKKPESMGRRISPYPRPQPRGRSTAAQGSRGYP